MTGTRGKSPVLAALLALAVAACTGSPATPGARSTATPASSPTGAGPTSPSPSLPSVPPTSAPAPAPSTAVASPATSPATSPWRGTLFYSDSGPSGGYNALVERTLFPTGKARQLLLGDENQGVGVLVGPDLLRLLMTNDERPDVGGPDFHAQPVSRLYARDGRTYEDLGRGAGFTLSPDGTTLAWGQPTRMRTCTVEDDDCTEPPVRITIAPMSDLARRRQWGPFDDVRGLGWIGPDRLIMFERGGATALFRPSTGRRQPLDLGGEVLDLDPTTGRVLVTDSTHRILRLVALDGKVVWQRRWAGQEVYATFSPDGRTILADVVRRMPETLSRTSRLLLIDAGTRAERAVPRSDYDGDLVWSTTGRLFGYRRLTSDRQAFEYVVCRTDLREPCRVVHGWEAGISVLAIAD